MYEEDILFYKQARADGYKPAEVEFLITSQEVTVQNITMYPTRVVSDQSQVSSEGPWDKHPDIGLDIGPSAVPTGNGESSTFDTQLSTDDKFDESMDKSLIISDADLEDYSGMGIAKEQENFDGNLTDYALPTADAVSAAICLSRQLACIYCAVLAPLILSWRLRL